MECRTEAATNPAGFLTSPLGGTSEWWSGFECIDDNVYGQNTGGAREGVVTLTSFGWRGDPVLLTITQLGLAPSLVVSAPSG